MFQHKYDLGSVFQSDLISRDPPPTHSHTPHREGILQLLTDGILLCYMPAGEVTTTRELGQNRIEIFEVVVLRWCVHGFYPHTDTGINHALPNDHVYLRYTVIYMILNSMINIILPYTHDLKGRL